MVSAAGDGERKLSVTGNGGQRRSVSKIARSSSAATLRSGSGIRRRPAGFKALHSEQVVAGPRAERRAAHAEAGGQRFVEVMMRRASFVTQGRPSVAEPLDAAGEGLPATTLLELLQGISDRSPAMISAAGTSVVLGPDAVNALRVVAEALGRESQVTLRIGAHPHMLSPEQVGRELGVSRPFVYKLLDSGELPFAKVGSHRRVPADAVAAYLEVARERVGAADDLARDALGPGARDGGSTAALREAARGARLSGDPTALKAALRARRVARIARSLADVNGGE